MLPKMDPRQMEKMMQQMGISSRKLEVKRVVIECEDRNIVIEPAEVMQISMQGNRNYQVSGNEREEVPGPSSEDVKMVAEQCGCTEEEAKRALSESNGDIAEAIMKLKERD